jgi:hypothetical protein
MGQYPNTRFFLIKIAAKVGQVKALMLLVFFRGTVIKIAAKVGQVKALMLLVFFR